MILIKYRDEQGRGGGGVKNREMVNVRARKVFDKLQIYDNIGLAQFCQISLLAFFRVKDL